MSREHEETEVRRSRLLRVALILALWVFGFPALDRYGLNWDEALGDLFFGERYLSYFTSFDPVYLDFASDPYPADREPDLGLSPFKIRPWEYYPVANTLAALSSEVLSRRLGLVDVFDGFHALNLLLAALFVWVFFRLVETRTGTLAALAATGFLFLSPRVFCHLMANVKDFPLMVFYTLTLAAFLRAYERGSTRGLLGAGVLWGLTLGTKANALFLPAIVLAVVVLGSLPEPWRGRRRRLFLTLGGAGFLGAATMVAAWPYLWADPIGRYAEHLGYIGLRAGYTRAESVAPAFEAVLLTTPPIFLLFTLLGLVPALRRARARDRYAVLLLAWIAAVLGRFLLPGAINFDGVRHFLELFPPLAAVAGWGVAASARLVVRRRPAWPRRAVQAALLALALAPGLWAVTRTHPFQIAYWNVFAGGYDGARARGLPQASDYWGLSYRLGLEWLNAHAPPGALVAVPVVEHAVRLVASERLRPDLILLPVTTPYTPKIAPERLRLTREAARERPVYVMFVDRRDWRNELMIDSLTHLVPEATWRLEGEPVLGIYRYRWPLSDRRSTAPAAPTAGR